MIRWRIPTFLDTLGFFEVFKPLIFSLIAASKSASELATSITSLRKRSLERLAIISYIEASESSRSTSRLRVLVRPYFLGFCCYHQPVLPPCLLHAVQSPAHSLGRIPPLNLERSLQADEALLGRLLCLEWFKPIVYKLCTTKMSRRVLVRWRLSLCDCPCFRRKKIWLRVD